jgi:hypothetical protein
MKLITLVGLRSYAYLEVFHLLQQLLHIMTSLTPRTLVGCAHSRVDLTACGGLQRGGRCSAHRQESLSITMEVHGRLTEIAKHGALHTEGATEFSTS